MDAHADFIDALGGGTAIAEYLAERSGEKITADRIYKWKVIGVPYRWRPLVAELAESKSVVVPADLQPYAPPSKTDRNARKGSDKSLTDG